MKKLTWMMILVFVFTTTAILFAEAKITKDVIKIDTPKKKSKGSETVVTFDHKKHAEEYAKSCDKCHPAIKQELNAKENVKKVVHSTCKQCHNKDKPAKTFKCSTCHKVKVAETVK